MDREKDMNKQPSPKAVLAASAFARKDIANYSEFLSMEVSDATLNGLVNGALAAAYAVDFPIANPPNNKTLVDRQAGHHPLDERRVDEGFVPPQPETEHEAAMNDTAAAEAAAEDDED